MKFICRKLAEKVDRQLCSECTHYKTCKKDGYLEEVDRSLKIASKAKGAYIRDEDLNRILGSLKVPLSNKHESQVRLRQAARNYTSNKHLWDRKPEYAEIKDLLKKLRTSADKLTSHLAKLRDMTRISMGFRIELNKLLQAKGNDLAEVIEGISSLRDAADELLPKLQRDLPDMPFYLLVRELKEIFEQATSKKSATVGRISQIASTGSCSPFLEFVSSFLSVVGDTRENLSLESLAKRCQRALDAHYINYLKKEASLRALTGTPFKPDTSK